MVNEISGTGCSVLLIQDGNLESALIKMVLSGSQMETREAASQEEVNDVLSDFTPDIIIADWNADGVDGRALARDIKTRFRKLREVPCILITDQVITQKVRRELVIEGFRWVLRRPIVSTSLPSLIVRTLQDHDLRRRESGIAHQATGLTRVLEFGQTPSGACFEAVV